MSCTTSVPSSSDCRSQVGVVTFPIEICDSISFTPITNCAGDCEARMRVRGPTYQLETTFTAVEGETFTFEFDRPRVVRIVETNGLDGCGWEEVETCFNSIIGNTARLMLD